MCIFLMVVKNANEEGFIHGSEVLQPQLVVFWPLCLPLYFHKLWHNASICLDDLNSGQFLKVMIKSEAQTNDKIDLLISCKVYCQITKLNAFLPKAALVRWLFLLAGDTYIKPSNNIFSSSLLKNNLDFLSLVNV